ncbi:MAG TPA: CoA transferase [Paenalcaligenes sp.]|nr:CoA transferase [Paenalcaligenes sp.]
MSNTKPLDGLRVLELGQIAAGPYAASLLADLGADVVKIENPDNGDGMRQWPPLNKVDDAGEVYSENFASLNRNKRSVTLNLKDPADIQTLKALCAAADIVIENYRPGVLDRLGVGYEALKAVNPGIIMCSISGYGQTGPYATRGAFDVSVQAMSGLMSVTGEQDSGPVKCGVPVGDFGAGLYAAYTIMAAVLRRQATGIGAYIDCSMLGSLIGISALQTSEYFGTGKSAGRLGSAHPRNAPYQAYKASDDYFVIAAGTDRLWKEVCLAVDQPDLAEHPDYLTQPLRAKNQKALAKLLEGYFAQNTAAFWLDEFNRRGVPASPINTFADVVNDEHVNHLGLVQDLTLPNGVKTKTTAFPIKITDFQFDIRHLPPKLGEHNDEVIAEWTANETA